MMDPSESSRNKSFSAQVRFGEPGAPVQGAKACWQTGKAADERTANPRDSSTSSFLLQNWADADGRIEKNRHPLLGQGPKNIADSFRRQRAADRERRSLWQLPSARQIFVPCSWRPFQSAV